MPSNPAAHAVWLEAKAITSAAAAARRELTAGERRTLDALLTRLDRLEGRTPNPHPSVVRPEPQEGPEMTPNTFSEMFTRNGSAVAEYRALSIGTASAGGNTVPNGFVNELWRALEATSPVAAAARIFTTPDEADLDVPTLATQGSAVNVAEGSAIGGTNPTFGQIQLKAHRYAQLVRASNSLLNSNAVNLDSFMAELFANNLDAAVGGLWAFGTGTTEPQGYAHGAGSAVTGGTSVAGAFTSDNLADMLSGLDVKYQANAVFLASPSAVGTLRKLKDKDDRPLWQPSMALGEPATVLGRPVFTDRHLGAVETGGTSVVVMDPNAFAVRFGGGGVRIDRSDDIYFASDEVAFRAVIATDSKYLDTASAVRFVGGSA